MVALCILGALLLAGCVWFAVYCFKHAKEQTVFGVVGSFMVLLIIATLATTVYLSMRETKKPNEPAFYFNVEFVK